MNWNSQSRLNLLSGSNVQMEKYDAVIRKIKRKRRWVLVLSMIAAWVIIIFATPMTLEVLGASMVEYNGVHPAIAVVLLVLCLLISMFAYAAVSVPLFSSMQENCEPEKNLVLNVMLNKQKNVDNIYAMDYFYLGDFQAALHYSERMTENPSAVYAMSGLFYRARCEFMLGEYEALLKSAEEYANKLSGIKRVNPKRMDSLQKMDTVIQLMCAVSKDDTEAIKALFPCARVWLPSKPSECFFNYVMGLAALKTEDLVEAVYRFKLVKEQFPHTSFCRLAEEKITSFNVRQRDA